MIKTWKLRMRCSAGKIKRFTLIHELLTSWQSCIHQLSEITQISGSSWRAALHKHRPSLKDLVSRLWVSGSIRQQHNNPPFIRLCERALLPRRSYLTGRARSDNHWSLTKRKTLNLVIGAAKTLLKERACVQTEKQA